MTDATYQRAIEVAAKMAIDDGDEGPSDAAVTLLAALFCRSSDDIEHDVSVLIEEHAERAAAEDNCGGGVDERGCYCGRCHVSGAERARRRREDDDGDAAYDAWRDDRGEL